MTEELGKAITRHFQFLYHRRKRHEQLVFGLGVACGRAKRRIL